MYPHAIEQRYRGVPPGQGLPYAVRPDDREPADAVRRAQVPDRADAAAPQHRGLRDHRVHRRALGGERAARHLPQPQGVLRRDRPGEQRRCDRADGLGAHRLSGRASGARCGSACRTSRPTISATAGSNGSSTAGRRSVAPSTGSGPTAPTSPRSAPWPSPFPRLPEATRVRLELRLLAADGRGAEPQPPRDVFLPPAGPTAPAPPPRAPGAAASARLSDLGYEITDEPGEADLVVVETLTDAWRSYAQDGGQVLWLAERPDSYQTHLGQWGVAARGGRIVARRLGQQHELAAAGSPVRGHSHRGAPWTLPSPTSRRTRCWWASIRATSPAESTRVSSWAGCTTWWRWWPSGRSTAASSWPAPSACGSTWASTRWPRS